MSFSIYTWAAFIAFIIASLAIDLGVFNKSEKKPSFKSALLMTSVWFTLAMLFGLMLHHYEGQKTALDFITGYVVELSLSMDNIFVFVLIFRAFKVPTQYQHRVLFWGVMGAVVMRFIMIVFGVYLVQQFDWIFYIFGGFLIFSAVKLLFSSHTQEEVTKESAVLSWIKTKMKVTKEFYGQKFIVNVDGKTMFTPLALVLVLIEQTDLIFALDSIPAILAITQDPFIVFSSNIFAILGLRSLYFILVKVIDKFVYLHYALAVILGYIGVKMIISVMGIHISTTISLVVIFSSLLVAVLASAIKANIRQTRP